MPVPAPAPEDLSLRERFVAVRAVTERLAARLTVEDQCLQSMPDASPTKWHRAHTTWFFETFILERWQPGFRPFDPSFRMLFNSYYNAVGEQYPRPQRGLLSRPGVAEVGEYRRAVDAAIEALLAARGDEPELRSLIEVGLSHEEQHQELLVTDIKHALARSPLRPAIVKSAEPLAAAAASPPALEYCDFEGGAHAIGHDGKAQPQAFHFDNERPRHRVWLEPYHIACRPVSVGEYLQFIADGGYHEPSLWLSDGWAEQRRHDRSAPLYWQLEADGRASSYTLAGQRPLVPSEPACHLSYYEADAFARWAGKRLPTEAEWEVAAERGLIPVASDHLDAERLHPRTMIRAAHRGGVWEWTMSPYVAYPGYRAPVGAVGEYNGKFMCNQVVLRGGSCASPAGHVRTSYRNFFYPDARWQFSGLRLAGDGPA
ncbi:MAG: ergothioneine biosynthesis protein EgtB [Myxococcales bacterium]|nr:ergothioneine biosynthesis protein EgtB [Myxococcales bacterium]